MDEKKMARFIEILEGIIKVNDEIYHYSEEKDPHGFASLCVANTAYTLKMALENDELFEKIYNIHVKKNEEENNND